jgi:hypothetical protein
LAAGGAYRRFSAAGVRPDTCWIAREMDEEPTPSSVGMYGGAKEFESKYNDDRSAVGSCLSSRRRVLVRILTIAMRLCIQMNPGSQPAHATSGVVCALTLVSVSCDRASDRSE